jgi:hypothetical protein
MVSISSLEHTVPVGLLGEHTRIAFVLAVIFASISSFVGYRNPFSTVVDNGAKFTPAISANPL